MYSRQYGQTTLQFEASGGLLHGALVMQDRETDTYWSIMTGEAIAGEMAGTPLEELPVGEKTRWKDWVRKHPDTVVLSVGGKEDTDNAYADYYESDRGFRGIQAQDSRLKDKQPVYAFRLGPTEYAVPSEAVEGGKIMEIDGSILFFYRPRDAHLFASTVAYQAESGKFEKTEEGWVHRPSGALFDPGSARFKEGDPAGVNRLSGLDTYWYTWSLSNPETRLIR